MRYYEPDPKKIVQIDQPDIVIQRKTFVKEVKEDPELKKLLDSSTIAQKIKSGEGVIASDLSELELELSSLKPGFTIDNIQKYQNTDFLSFLHRIMGLTEKQDPQRTNRV